MARLPENAVISAVQPYTVTRAICMAGERVEIGSTVYLTRVQGTELATAGKVTPGAAWSDKAEKADKADKPAKAPAKSAAKADATPSDEAAK